MKQSRGRSTGLTSVPGVRKAKGLFKNLLTKVSPWKSKTKAASPEASGRSSAAEDLKQAGEVDELPRRSHKNVQTSLDAIKEAVRRLTERCASEDDYDDADADADAHADEDVDCELDDCGCDGDGEFPETGMLTESDTGCLPADGVFLLSLGVKNLLGTNAAFLFGAILRYGSSHFAPNPNPWASVADFVRGTRLSEQSVLYAFEQLCKNKLIEPQPLSPGKSCFKVLQKGREIWDSSDAMFLSPLALNVANNSANTAFALSTLEDDFLFDMCDGGHHVARDHWVSNEDGFWMVYGDWEKPRRAGISDLYVDNAIRLLQERANAYDLGEVFQYATCEETGNRLIRLQVDSYVKLFELLFDELCPG